MVKCSYDKCLEQKRDLGPLSFFEVPNDQRRAVWLKHGNVSAKQNPHAKYFFCEKHFYEKDIKCLAVSKRLLKFAVPKSSRQICSCSQVSVDASCSRLMNAYISRKHPTSNDTSMEIPSGSQAQPDSEQRVESESRPQHRPECRSPFFFGSPSREQVPPESTSPALSLIDMPINVSTTYLRNYGLGPVNFDVPVSPSQFPSPGFHSYAMPEKEVERKRKFIPRNIFETPKRIKRDPLYEIKKFLDTFLEGFPEDVQIFVRIQFLHKPNSPWSKEEKSFSLRFFYKSPSAYLHFLDMSFKLPAKSTIYRWHSELRLRAGMNDLVLEMLKDKGKTMSDLNKKCVLLFDEMAIKRELEYNIKDDIVYGIEDFGEFGRENIVASKVMVFTLRGLNANWKQTVCYYIGSPKAEMVSKMIVNVAEKVNNCGLHVVATCCDQASTNVRAYNILTSPSRFSPWFEIESHRIFVLYDYPHMFKSVRNILLKNQILIQDDIVDWKILEKICEVDKISSTFRTLYGISNEHVHPDNFQKLVVRLATQVFSAKVAAGVKTAIACGVFTTDADIRKAEFLSSFCGRMNNLFDTLNTSQLYSRNPNKQALSDSTRSLDVLKDSQQWIKTWRSSGRQKIPPCFVGLVHTLGAIEEMWEYEKGNGQNFLLLSHLNTDVAENIFSMVRMNRGSYERNPSSYRFMRNLKEIMFHNLCSAAHSGYKDAGAVTLLDLGDIPKEILNEEKNEPTFLQENLVGDLMNLRVVVPHENPNLMEHGDEEEEDQDEQDFHEEHDTNKSDNDIAHLKSLLNDAFELEFGPINNSCPSEKLKNAALLYYSGFAADKLKKKLKCTTCSQFLIDQDIVEREQDIMVSLRAFATTTTASKYGKLTIPSERFENTVREAERIIVPRLRDYLRTESVTRTKLPEVKAQLEGFLVSCCSEDHKDKIVLFIMIGIIIMTLKNTNKDLRNDGTIRFL